MKKYEKLIETKWTVPFQYNLLPWRSQACLGQDTYDCNMP